jgi:soluble lytic murein transglycosylase
VTLKLGASLIPRKSSMRQRRSLIVAGSSSIGCYWRTTALYCGLVACISWLPTSALAQSVPAQSGAPPPNGGQPNGAQPSGSQTTVAPSNRPIQPTVVVPVLQPAEVEHHKRFDAFVAKVRDTAVSADDATRIKDAFKAISTNTIAQAKSLRSAVSDPTARTLIDWAIHRSGAGTAKEIRAFADAHLEWPDQALLATRADEQMFTEGGDPATIRAYFQTGVKSGFKTGANSGANSGEPQTAAGLAALASAHLAEGDQAAAKVLAAKAWRSNELAATLETGFVARFQSLLTVADHRWRLDRMLIDDTRWATDRTARTAGASRLLALLPEAERKKAEARIAVYLRSANAATLMAALPADAATVPTPDWGFAHSLAQWHRRAGRHSDAWKILIAAPVDPAITPNLDGWWEERRAGAYEALKQGKAQVAYDLVRNPGPLSVNPLKDATFLAGWIAFRHLNDAKRAEGHFAAFAKAADGPLSRAKSSYWGAKVADATGNKSAAASYRKIAAAQFDTFYGLLTRQELDPKATSIKITPPEVASSEQVQKFNAHPVVKAAVIAKKAGVDPAIVRSFFNHLRQIMTTEAEVAMVAHLAEALGETQTSLRIAKAAIARGQNLMYYAYPLKPMPAYQPFRAPPEPAFMLSIARQESEFNTATLSGAGARGLMQVMPITAEHVCRDYKVKCEISRLMTDRSYNASMASAYIADRMDEFQGSYVLSLAGYNAGPGRTRQWIREFGDPRLGNPDPVDWIHRIPFEETREYVQKVLANIQIYRARLGDEAGALRLSADLKRVSPGVQRRAASSALPAIPGQRAGTE